VKAVIYTEYGPPEVLQVKDVPKPEPREGEVLVKIHATSVNRSDWECLIGEPLYARMGGLRKPGRRILGSDIAGRVEAIGPNVTRFNPGDEVFGDIMNTMGGFAEYVCVREKILAPKPPDMSFEEASLIPQAGVIALQGIRDKGLAGPGKQVLINGAGGATGVFAIQLARQLGAEVTGVDREAKHDLMRSLGADHVIDYTQDDFTRSGKSYDLILDLVAYRSVFAYRRALKRGGSYFYVGGSVRLLLAILLLGPVIRRFTGKKIGFLAVRPNTKDMLYVAEQLQSGQLKSVIDRRFPLEEVPEALRYLGEGHARGKLVITVAQD
jgi:NADPH:quinone reductase-like Zn-dependent oxidoreductase